MGGDGQIVDRRHAAVLRAFSEHCRIYSALFNSAPLSSTAPAALTVYHLLKVELPVLFIVLSSHDGVGKALCF